MSFSNPASQAKENSAAYVKALMDLLGTRDPFEVQAQQLELLEAEIADLADAALRQPEKPGKWSILQVLQHLADSELVTSMRLRMILAHDTPDIQGYDQDAWAAKLNYSECSLTDTLEQLRVLRRVNLKLLHSLNESQMNRVGIHSERGPESVRRISQLVAGHDLLHLNQIRRIKKAIGV